MGDVVPLSWMATVQGKLDLRIRFGLGSLMQTLPYLTVKLSRASLIHLTKLWGIIYTALKGDRIEMHWFVFLSVHSPMTGQAHKKTVF